MGKVKILGPQVGYIELLEHYTKKKIEANSGTQRWMPLRPSAAGKCARELAYEYDAYKNETKYEITPRTVESTRILDFGNSVEYHLIRQFEDAFKYSKDIKVKYKQQKLLFFKLPSGDTIEGSIDSVFVSEKFKVLIDYKSKKDKFSSFYASKWTEDSQALRENKFVTEFGVESFYIDDLKGFLENLNDAFFAQNFQQLNLYFFDEGHFLRNVGVDHAALIYYNKSDSRIREIRFKPNEEVYNAVKEKFIRVDNAITQGKGPDSVERDFNLGSLKCAFCDYNKVCWGDNAEPLKDYFKTLPKKRWPTDIDRIPNHAEITALFKKYKEAVAGCNEADLYETQIIAKLVEKKIWKVKFDADNIYDVTKLKTGGVKNGPRFVLRRGKL